MNQVSKSGKIAGKIFAALTFLLLAAVFAASIYIGGQKKAVEKLCTAIAADDYKAFSGLYDSPASEEFFSSIVSTYCSGLAESSTDIIGTDVEINQHSFSPEENKWICSADIDFYCSGKNSDFDNVIFELALKNGKWYIISIK